MKIIGLDPGFDRLGMAVIEVRPKKKESLVFSVCFSTSRNLTFPDRLLAVGKEFEAWCGLYQPQAVALEKIFFTKNQKTAMQIAEVRGLLIYLARRQGLTVIELTPQEIKKTLAGYGGADKKQVARMVRMILRLPNKKKLLDDETDAIALGLSAIGRLPKLSTTKT